ncbi:LysM peptidoglycan-binding domain-containing protein [Roseibaca sp. Y0-43]|uniref:LysM peptidoglycan-binding domain-containing protein n=1 Tax=Roseibaca sp. Y0-43 TaxID=2816854 RepID=UPI001D0C9A28|nr:LysM peptidoglycan-binding domain-containing protein [Roseibaca sp. Y0-43]MCC1482093.1 LysM peptidoglycan-binding domain-containing protein [Roseibaca sp. Y0-43]
MLKYLPKDTLAQWAVGSVAVVGAASVAYVLVFPEQDAPQLPAPSVPMIAPEAANPPAAVGAPDLRIASVAAVQDAAPVFDIVRVTDLGNVLIAGQAPARVQVAALIDEAQVADTVSSDAGEFVMLFDVAPSRSPRVLELEVRLPEGGRIRSADTLMLAPSSAALAEGAGDAPQMVAREVATTPLFGAPSDPTRPELSAEAESAALAEGSTRQGLPADAADATAPLAVLMRSDGSVQVLGDAPRLPGAGGATGNVVIDSVVYDREGDIVMGGRSARGLADIQIYLDNQPILRTRADADGAWQAQLAGIERGVYRLRVDELDAASQVVSRAEIPFERVTPELAREAAGPQALIVQPGNTLWDMSEQNYGDGRRFMRIFDANRDQIRDPDLIYPGQVFVLPDAATQ